MLVNIIKTKNKTDFKVENMVDVWKIIFYSIRSKHPEWSNKKITTCTRYAYRKSHR